MSRPPAGDHAALADHDDFGIVVAVVELDLLPAILALHIDDVVPARVDDAAVGQDDLVFPIKVEAQGLPGPDPSALVLVEHEVAGVVVIVDEHALAIAGHVVEAEAAWPEAPGVAIFGDRQRLEVPATRRLALPDDRPVADRPTVPTVPPAVLALMVQGPVVGIVVVLDPQIVVVVLVPEERDERGIAVVLGRIGKVLLRVVAVLVVGFAAARRLQRVAAVTIRLGKRRRVAAGP